MKTHDRVLRIVGHRWTHGSESIRDRDLVLLAVLIERDDPRCRLCIKAVQPVKEIYQRFQTTLLASLYCFAQTHPCFLHIWIILEREVLPLKREGVVEEELRSVFENTWESIP